MYSSYGPGQPYPAPYYFDGRWAEQPYFRSPWRYHQGVRGRAYLPNVTLDAGITKQDSIKQIEQMIVKEAGLELAFEGHRWTDFLYDKLHRKYEMAGLPVPDFTDKKNWYLPLYK
jgi:hypothetical protein